MLKFALMRSNNQFNKRNTQVRNYVKELFKKYPEWKYDSIMQKTADKYFLSPRTVQAIVKGEGIYAY